MFSSGNFHELQLIGPAAMARNEKRTRIAAQEQEQATRARSSKMINMPDGNCSTLVC